MTSTPASHGGAASDSPESGDNRDARMTLLVYSDDATTRAKVRLAIGRRPSADLPRVDWVECATAPAVLAKLANGKIDVCIFDGEAAPTGGMGLARQIKDEIYRCPPVLVLTGRVQDNWLATWSRADAAVAHPLDPIVLARSVGELMRERLAKLPAR
jgi:DNA-binding response OmpR family regulator